MIKNGTYNGSELMELELQKYEANKFIKWLALIILLNLF